MTERPRDTEHLPPNGGWGWLIVLAYSISSTVMGAIIQSFTLLYKDTFTELHMSTTKIAVVTNTNIALGLVSGLFLGPLLRKYGHRKVAVLGSLLVFIGIVLTGFASSFLHMCFTYGFITSLGAGLVCPTTLMALRGYFSSRQGTAMRVAVRMAGVAPILLPPLVAFLMDRYGVQGATLVVGAFSLHCLLGAVLLRPIKWHLKKRDHDVEEGHRHKPVGDISEHDVADEMRRRGTIVPIMKIDAPEDDDQNEGTQQDHHDSDGSRPTSASRGSFADPSGNLDLPGYEGERHASIGGVSLQSSGSRRGSSAQGGNVWWSKLSMGSVYSASSGRLYDMRAVQVAGGKEDDSDYSSDDGEDDNKEKKRSKNSSQPQRRETIAMTPGSLDVPENSYQTGKRHSSASIKSGQEKWWSRMSVGSIYAGSSSRIFGARVVQVAEGETDEEEDEKEQGIELDALDDKYSSSQDKQNTEDIYPNTLEVPDMGKRAGRRHSSSVSTRSGQGAEMWWSKPSSGSIHSGSSVRLHEGENGEDEGRFNKSGEIDYSDEEGERNIKEKLLPQRRGTVADVPSTQLNVPNSDRMKDRRKSELDYEREVREIKRKMTGSTSMKLEVPMGYKDKRNASVTSIKSSGSGYLTAAQSLRTSRSQGSGVWWSTFSLSSIYSTSGTRLSDMRVVLPAAKVDDEQDQYDDQISEDEEQDEGDEQIAEDEDSDRQRTEPLKKDRMEININNSNSESIIMNGFHDEENRKEHITKSSTQKVHVKGRDELKAKTEDPSEISLKELEPTKVSVQRQEVTNELDRILADGVSSDTNLKQNHIEVKSDISSKPSVPNDKISSTEGLYPHLDVKVWPLDERIDVKTKDESYDEDIANKISKETYAGKETKISLVTVDIEGFPDKMKNDGTYDKFDTLTSIVNEQVGIKEVNDSISVPEDLESTPLIEALGTSNYNEITISIPENSLQTEVLLEHNNGAKNRRNQPNQIEKIPRLDLNPLRDPSFVNLILGLAISSCADTNFSFLIPLLLGDLDFNNEKIAFIMSVIACADITARFVAPSLAGIGKFSDRTMYLVGLVLLVISRTFVTYYTSFKELLWVGAAIGLSRGVKNTYDPTVIPLDTLPSTLVLQMVSTGVIYFILGPLVGYILDVSGSFRTSIVTINFLTLVAVVMWCLETTMNYVRRTNTN